MADDFWAKRLPDDIKDLVQLVGRELVERDPAVTNFAITVEVMRRLSEDQRERLARLMLTDFVSEARRDLPDASKGEVEEETVRRMGADVALSQHEVIEQFTSWLRRLA